MRTVSISKRLLTRLLSSYVILTLIVTGVQLVAEYLSIKKEINNELRLLQQTISASLSQAIWELNEQQIQAMGEGLLAMPVVVAVVIRDENDSVIFFQGDKAGIVSSAKVNQATEINDPAGRLFGYSSLLQFRFADRSNQNRSSKVGTLALFSSNQLVLSQLEFQVVFPIAGMIFSILLIFYLFTWMFRRQLTNPLKSLSDQIAGINLEDLSDAKIQFTEVEHKNEQNELSVLAFAFNQMMDKLEEYKYNLEQAKQELVQANHQLDQQNVYLEREVARKTSNLSKAVIELDQQKKELEQHQQELREENERRKQTETELTNKHQQLRRSMNQLQQAQTQLVESEKMASLGALVAGIAHEINTPVGIGVTAVSYLDDRLNHLGRDVKNKTLTAKNMDKFLVEASESCSLLVTNLDKASHLIQSFKEIAVDQTSEAIREVNLNQYLGEVIISLQPKLKRTRHQIKVHCDEDIEVNCRAGALSQIFTNLIINSITHAFEENQAGLMEFELLQDEHWIYINYSDNGKGVSKEHLQRLFEPFFTTRRGQGGSGLGTHILYNLVIQSLHGAIQVDSTPGEGLHYKIKFPRVLPETVIASELSMHQ